MDLHAKHGVNWNYKRTVKAANEGKMPVTDHHQGEILKMFCQRLSLVDHTGPPNITITLQKF